MPTPKSAIKNGKTIHFSVGAVIKRGEKYLLIDNIHYGFAGIAGHLDEGEEPAEAIKREVKEESGLQVNNCGLLFEEFFDWNWCSQGITGHNWYLFDCEVNGEAALDIGEAKSIGWYNVEEIKKLDLEPVWKYWFEKLKIL